MLFGRLFYTLTLVTSVGLAACSSSYAKGAGTIGDEPKRFDCVQQANAAQQRDSIYHRFMDSIDFRIQELNAVAHRVDSLARLFKDNGHQKIHMDGKSFGPFKVPSLRIPAPANAPSVVHDIETPEVEVPGITVPDIDIEVNMPDLSDISAHTNHGTFTVSGTLTPDGLQYFGAGGTLHGSMLSSDPVQTKYRDPATGKDYFIRNVPPSMHAQHVTGNVWLIEHK